MRLCLPLAFPVVLLALTGCASRLPTALQDIAGVRASDEEQIAALLNDVQRGFESRRIYKVLAHIAPGYQDANRRDYQTAREDLRRFLEEYRNVRITRVGPRVVVQGNHARAIEAFGAVAEPQDPSAHLPISIQGQIEIYLEKMAGTWQITGWKSTG